MINTIVLKLKQLIFAAKIRSFTVLNAKSKCCKMELDVCYDPIIHENQRVSSSIRDQDIDDLALSAKENSDIDYLLEVLKDFESLSQTLQKYDKTILDVRVLFNAILESYPICEERLSPT